ncbi:DUF3489 domain-containing protein [Sphingomonas sp. 1P06PA]|uniref:DUF3489 domain-containing protein n=1 Tax=Sphingomonas sp. 1P06PA TaxID=554121 RepID=UPI0039A74B26
MTIQLSDAQLAVLTAALSRPDRCIYPIATPLKGGAVGNIAKSLLKRGLLEEVPACEAHTVWRCDADGHPLTLCATGAAEAALSGELEQSGDRADSASEPHLASELVVDKRGAATAAMIACLLRHEGASIIDLQKVTGWQPHSVRGALSAVIAKKLGHMVTSAKEAERGRVYRIAH